MRVGYIRVSSEGQNTARQEVLMQELGIEKLYIDKMSGKNKNRPQLQAMIAFVRDGDIVVVESISRFARNTRDLLELIDMLKARNVGFVSKKEAIDTSTSQGKFMLTIFAAVSELERDYILDRQKEGIEIAKREGKFKGRKPQAVNEALFSNVYAKWKAGSITAVQAMQEVGLKANTFYRRVKQHEGGIKE